MGIGFLLHRNAIQPAPPARCGGRSHWFAPNLLRETLLVPILPHSHELAIGNLNNGDPRRRKALTNQNNICWVIFHEQDLHDINLCFLDSKLLRM